MTKRKPKLRLYWYDKRRDAYCRAEMGGKEFILSPNESVWLECGKGNTYLLLRDMRAVGQECPQFTPAEQRAFLKRHGNPFAKAKKGKKS